MKDYIFYSKFVKYEHRNGQKIKIIEPPKDDLYRLEKGQKLVKFEDGLKTWIYESEIAYENGNN